MWDSTTKALSTELNCVAGLVLELPRPSCLTLARPSAENAVASPSRWGLTDQRSPRLAVPEAPRAPGAQVRGSWEVSCGPLLLPAHWLRRCAPAPARRSVATGTRTARFGQRQDMSTTSGTTRQMGQVSSGTNALLTPTRHPTHARGTRRKGRPGRVCRRARSCASVRERVAGRGEGSPGAKDETRVGGVRPLEMHVVALWRIGPDQKPRFVLDPAAARSPAAAWSHSTSRLAATPHLPLSLQTLSTGTTKSANPDLPSIRFATVALPRARVHTTRRPACRPRFPRLHRIAAGVAAYRMVRPGTSTTSRARLGAAEPGREGGILQGRFPLAGHGGLAHGATLNTARHPLRRRKAAWPTTKEPREPIATTLA